MVNFPWVKAHIFENTSRKCINSTHVYSSSLCASGLHRRRSYISSPLTFVFVGSSIGCASVDLCGPIPLFSESSVIFASSACNSTEFRTLANESIIKPLSPTHPARRKSSVIKLGRFGSGDTSLSNWRVIEGTSPYSQALFL